MKTADEILKETGWDLLNRISYNGIVKCEIYIDKYLNGLEFDFTEKTFEAYNNEGETIKLTMQDLQVINKKVEELGWI